MGTSLDFSYSRPDTNGMPQNIPMMIKITLVRPQALPFVNQLPLVDYSYSHPDTSGKPKTLSIVIRIPLVDFRIYMYL